ncbi:unnamed protein product, partial [Medioppia subpectinata]
QSVNTDEFGKPELIGRGGFGAVYKVKHNSSDELYAIKTVTFPASSDAHKQRVLNEVKSLENVRSKYVVQYYTSWIDNNRLYIQMEYCPQSLRKLLADKALAFGRQSPDEPMNAFEYFISCEIFKELLESVQYLHELNPRVIHRDLKPDNVLLTNTLSGNNNNSRRFITLGDFGLATVHDPSRHTDSRYQHSAVGTRGYIAPEVFKGRYNHKSDIYSLSIIGQELFDIDLQASKSFEANESLFKSCMSQTLEKMMSSPRWTQRPECREVLAKHNECEILQPMTNNITPMDLNNGQSQVSQNNSYRNNFDELGDPIGRGGFGTVFKVRHKWDGNVYAVKKVTFPVNGSDGRQQRVLKEAQSLAKLSPQYVVRYHYSWLEDNVLYIQMEYCPQSLRKLLADKALAFGRQSVKPMKPFEYYISCIIFKELLECVKYLHKLDPQVIHRDLKPENILISQNLRSNRCVKLCDFGLATEHNPNRLSASHTLGVGTFPYMAPEVFDDKYNPKSDIYSLGIIGKELFGIDFNL